MGKNGGRSATPYLTMIPDTFATRDDVLPELAAAERREGWLATCEQAGRYLVVTGELADALARLIATFEPGAILEVCAGRGELAAALQERGTKLVATDTDPPAGSAVVRLDAAEALERSRPRTVIGCFVPVDAGVDEAVLAAPSVQQYLVIGTRLNGQLGAPGLWSARGWRPKPLAEVTRLLVTRHDVWLDDGHGVLGRGEAWLFRRTREEKRRRGQLAGTARRRAPCLHGRRTNWPCPLFSLSRIAHSRLAGAQGD